MACLDTAPAPFAAIVYGDGIDANGPLEMFAREMRRQGLRVRGLVQYRAGDIHLTDLDGGGDYRISQSLGNGAAGCSLDPGGMAEASMALRRALTEPSDLLVVNKFGKLEAHGRGFVPEMAEALSNGLPVITTVHERHLESWRDLMGATGSLLPPDFTSAFLWWRTFGVA
ncbi:conserved hypothetical protein [Candidatus Terasakiella magnetica]|nr:conserved hypothetical protein [Candidatus Terasakiella magnetica]